MSRIHEALKRAEQERAATRGAMTPGDLAQAEAGERAAAFLQEPTITSNPSAPGPVLGFSGPMSLEALLTRSAHLEWKPNLETILFMNGNENVPGTEEYRTLRSRLCHLREQTPLKTLLVTSALPKEGKSFTAVNLAQVMRRQEGRRVLLIDADMRAPQLHSMLGTTQGPGLSDYLQGKSDEFSVIQRGPVENLFFIPSGTTVGEPADLVGNGRLKALIQRVEQLFDWIIVDSPPAVAVSDASVLAKACDGVLMVVRSNSTPADLARKARQEFPDQALIGVVLNAAGPEDMPYGRYYETYQKRASGTES